MNAGSGGDTLNAGTGLDTMVGGTGNDTFNLYSYNLYIATKPLAGTSVTGGGGNDVLIAPRDITAFTINNVQTVQAMSDSLYLTNAQFTGFTNFTNGYGLPISLDAMTAGTYDLSGKTLTGSYNTSAFNMSAAFVNAAITLIGNNQNGQVLTGGSGTTVLTAGNGAADQLVGGSGATTMTAGSGAGDILTAGTGATTMNAGSGGDTLNDGTGVDIMNGGAGNDTFTIWNATAGGSVNGGGGSDKIAVYVSNITGLTITGVSTLDVMNGSVTLANAQFSAFANLISGTGLPRGRLIYLCC